MPLSRINANSIADGTVVAAEIANSAITEAKIADAAVTSSKLAVISNVTITGGNVFNVGFTIENVISTSNVITLNYANATVFTCTATEETTITPTNFPASGVALLKLRNGGDHTITYAANAQFAAGTPPTLTASGLDHLVFEGNSTVYTVTSVLDIQED